MSHSINLKSQNYPKFLGNIKILKRGKETQIGFSYNAETNKIYFDPARIDGASMDIVWGAIVKKEMNKYTHEVNNSFIFTQDEILGVAP